MHRQEWFRLLANGNDHRWVKILHQTNQEYLKTGRCHIHQGLYYQYCSFRATGLQLLVGYVCASSLQISFSLSLLICTHIGKIQNSTNCRSGFATAIILCVSSKTYRTTNITRAAQAYLIRVSQLELFHAKTHSTHTHTDNILTRTEHAQSTKHITHTQQPTRTANVLHRRL